MFSAKNFEPNRFSGHANEGVTQLERMGNHRAIRPILMHNSGDKELSHPCSHPAHVLSVISEKWSLCQILGSEVGYCMLISHLHVIDFCCRCGFSAESRSSALIDTLVFFECDSGTWRLYYCFIVEDILDIARLLYRTQCESKAEVAPTIIRSVPVATVERQSLALLCQLPPRWTR